MTQYAIPERTFTHILRDKAARNGDRPFLHFEDRTYSYAETDLITNRIANSFLANSVVAERIHVAVIMENKPEQLFAYFALAKIRAVAIPINTAAKGEMLYYFLSQSDSEVVIVDASFADRVAEVIDKLSKISRVIIVGDGLSHDDIRWTAKISVLKFQDLIADASDLPPSVTPLFNDLFMLIYTSGTTGRSKANMSTNCHALTCGIEIGRAYKYSQDDIVYVCLPLFHGNAFLCSCLPALVSNAAIALSRRFSASAFWDQIRRYGVTQFNSLGAMTNFLWAAPRKENDADNPVRLSMVVPTPREFYKEFEVRFGLKFCSLYALTDVGIVSITRPDDPADTAASAGRPCDNMEVRIVDDDDFDVPTGVTGEIVVRSREPWVLPLGYYKMTEATLGTWRNLWFHTGDRGCMDPKGYLYFVDRKKDAIRRRGENISSYEVEQIILKNESILEAAAFPVTSEHTEDEVMVSIVLREGAELSAEGLVDFCQTNMPYFMVPRYVEFLPSLPKTMTEKVEKYKLKQSAETRLSNIWDRERAGIKLVR